ncbi:MAG: hypothetical protein AB7R40_22030 [Nitrospiraceae bacterium]
MKYARHALFIVVLAIIGGTVAASAADDLGTRVSLQATMRAFIDRQSIDGAFLTFDVEHGRVRSLYPKSAHPVLYETSDFYILCYDFAESGGDIVNVDFYVPRSQGPFIVVHTEVGNHELIDRMAATWNVAKAK